MANYRVPVLESIEWQQAVADKDLVTSPAAAKGDRYIIAGTGGQWSGGTIKDIAYCTIAGEAGAAIWSFDIPSEGWIVWVKDENAFYYYNGSSWKKMGLFDVDVSDNLTFTQNSVIPFTSINSGAVVNTLYLKEGKVGIGIDNPGAKLDINTSSLNNVDVFVASSDTTENIKIIQFASGNYRWGEFTLNHRDDSSVDTIPIQINPRNVDIKIDSVTNHNILLNPTGGNVGINTTTGLAKLSINGGCHVGGDSDPGDNNLLIDGIIGVGISPSVGVVLRTGGDLTSGIYQYGLSFDGTFSGTTQTNLLYLGGIVKASTAITKWAGIRIDNPALGAGASITTQYQMYISTPTRGVDNYAIYSPGGKVFLAGKTGIGTATGLAKLSINGGCHVGGDSDPGDNNLLIDGTIEMSNGTSINEFSTDGTLAGDSDDAIPTEKAIKTYIDAHKVDTTLIHGIVNTSDLALQSGKLSQFAATTSAELAGIISDESGSGLLVFSNSPTLVTPILGTPASGVATNLTGTASGLTAGNVTTNANLTGVITSVGNATSIASQTGTGTKFVVDTSPTLVTPALGVATGTSLVLTQTTNASLLKINNITTGKATMAFQSNGVNKGFVGLSGGWEGDNTLDLSLVAETGYGLRFYTNGSMAEVVAITSGNVVDLKKGQLKFPATQNPSADANTLDDYEEGYYEPTLTCGTSGTITINPAIKTLAYTKIGRKVTVTGYLSVSAVSVPVGSLQLSLPYDVVNLTQNAGYSAGTVVFGLINAISLGGLTVLVDETYNCAKIVETYTVGYLDDVASHIKTSSYFMFSITYFTN